MSYLETIRAEADARLKKLADAVAKLARELDRLKRQAATERENVTKFEENLANFKGLAGERVTLGQNEFAKFKVQLRRDAATLDAAREAVTLLDVELIPGKSRELTDARYKLEHEFAALYEAAKPTCEAAMVRLLDVVIGEHDAFVSAFADLRKIYGVPCGNLTPPRASSRRFASLDSFGLSGRPLALRFKPAPPITPPPQPTPPLGPVAKTPPESTPTVAVGQSATEEAPRAPKAPPAAIAPVEEALDADTLPPKRRTLLTGIVTPQEPFHDAPQSEPSGAAADAQDAPGSKPTAALEGSVQGAVAPDTLSACPAAAALDALDIEEADARAADAEEADDLEADAPTEAEKENPGISPLDTDLT